ncbi:MAG: hypothetical protein OQK48_08220 [Sulfurimonas sp.]|nr:hypothetical protein [Sulfurimonas sp.]
MSSIIGKVSNIDGKFYAKGTDSPLRDISQGDEIYDGESVIGSADNVPKNNITVSLNDGSNISIGGNSKQLFDSSLSSEVFTKEETVTVKDSIQALLEEYGDIKPESIETAAEEENTEESSENIDVNFAQTNNAATDIDAKITKVFQSESSEDIKGLGDDVVMQKIGMLQKKIMYIRKM